MLFHMLFWSHSPRHERTQGQQTYSFTHSEALYQIQVSCQFQPPVALPSGKASVVPIAEQAIYAPELLSKYRRREKSFTLTGNRAPEGAAHRTVTRHNCTTELTKQQICVFVLEQESCPLVFCPEGLCVCVSIYACMHVYRHIYIYINAVIALK